MGTKKVNITPEHLGGHNNTVWTDEGALKWLIDNYNIGSMLDVGCGPGSQTEMAEGFNLFTLGIDGDPLFKNKSNIQIHDYTLGPINKDNITKIPKCGYYDLGWSVEFLEHVEAKYIDNFMQTF